MLNSVNNTSPIHYVKWTTKAPQRPRIQQTDCSTDRLRGASVAGQGLVLQPGKGRPGAIRILTARQPSGTGLPSAVDAASMGRQQENHP